MMTEQNAVAPATKLTLEQIGVQIKEAAKSNTKAAWEIGRLLVLAKKEIGHGNFDAWKQEHLPGYSKMTLNRYMRLWKQNKEGADNLQGLSQEYRKIAPPKKITVPAVEDNDDWDSSDLEMTDSEPASSKAKDLIAKIKAKVNAKDVLEMLATLEGLLEEVLV